MPHSHRRAAAAAKRRRIVRVWAAVYVVVVAVIVFWPSTGDLVDPSLRWLHRVTQAPLPTVEFTTNVVLFIPFGMLAASYLPLRRCWLALMAGAAASTVIEVVQGSLLPGRHPSLSDIEANTAGAALGVLVVSVVRLARRRPRAADPTAPGGHRDRPTPRVLVGAERRWAVDASEAPTEPISRQPAYRAGRGPGGRGSARLDR